MTIPFAQRLRSWNRLFYRAANMAFEKQTKGTVKKCDIIIVRIL